MRAQQLPINIFGKRYLIDLSKMKQINISTGWERGIRQSQLTSSSSSPSQQQQQQNSHQNYKPITDKAQVLAIRFHKSEYADEFKIKFEEGIEHFDIFTKTGQTPKDRGLGKTKIFVQKTVRRDFFLVNSNFLGGFFRICT